MVNPFDSFEPDDGFRVVFHDQGKLEISLHVGLFVDGSLCQAFAGDPQQGSEEIWCKKLPTAMDRGKRRRAALLSSAICRYFNSGGDWSELEQIQSDMRRIVQGGLSVDGWYYFDGYIDTEGSFTTVWANPAGEVVRWVEGSFIDTGLTLDDLAREAEEDDPEQATHHQSQSSDYADTAAADDDEKFSPRRLLGPEAEG